MQVRKEGLCLGERLFDNVNEPTASVKLTEFGVGFVTIALKRLFPVCDK